MTFVKNFFVIVLILFSFSPANVFANGAGLPQFFKINDKYPSTNPLQIYGITAQSFLIPQDIAPDRYLINQPVDFSIETEPLTSVIPESLLAQTTFSWDFGDGTKAEGLENTHTYTKIGSYILVLTINVFTQDSQTPTQFVDSFLLDVVPSNLYRDVPRAVIKVNGLPASADPRYNLLHLDFQDQVVFDASQSKSPGAKIIAYFWNFGDGQSSTKIQTSHQYEKQEFVAAVLRVKDNHGFISDAFVGLRNDEGKGTGSQKQLLSADTVSTLLLVILGITALFILIGLMVRRKRSIID